MQRQTPEVGRHLAQSRTVPRTGRRRIPCDSDCAPSARRLAHPGRLLRASRRRPIRHLHPRIGGIRRHVEPLQLHRRQLDGPAALQQRSGRLAGQGPGWCASHRWRGRSRSRHVEDSEGPACGRPAEPDQRSDRHGRLGCHPPLGTDPARRSSGRDRPA